MSEFKSRKFDVLYICDKTDPYCCMNELCGGKGCNRTAQLKYALHRKDIVKNYERFLRMYCLSYATDERIIFMEIDDEALHAED